MTVSSAPPAEQTRNRPGAKRGELRRTLVASSAMAARITPLSTATKILPSGRAETLAARRLARRQRRLIAAMGLLVLAGMLALTVIVLDVVH